MEKLLIIDDSEDIRKQLKWGLGKEYSIFQAGERGEGVALYKAHRPKAVTLDLGLPPHPDGVEEGLKCLEEILRENPYAKVIIISGNDERENALKAVKNGAYDVYQKPIDLNEIKVVVKRAFHLYDIEEENRRLHQALDGKTAEGSRLIGQCPKMLEVAATIRKVASSDVSVLIMGESGTGKELVSRAIHSMSLRKGEAFIPINCGAIPENLLESELFGHEKGAFTGAHAQVQKFREDLYYRLGVITINLPPLREREGDIMLLSNLFLSKSCEQFGKKIRGFTSEAAKRLESYNWPGNVRELENRVQRAVIMSEGALIGPQDLGFASSAEGRLKTGTDPNDATTLKDARDRVEKEFVTASIERNRGNIARAAEELGISRPTLYDLMKKHGLQNLT